MKEKKFQNKKFEKEDHKGIELGAKIFRGLSAIGGGTALAATALYMKKNGPKAIKTGVELVSKFVSRT